METTHKQEYRIRDLPTRSVTLFPTRAQVVREIKNVALKSGANEITLLGLTPTADEQSIKVEGTGSAIITDITVELLPNRDIFQDIYPDSDNDSETDKSEDEDDHDNKEDVNQAVEAVREKLIELADKQKRAKEIIASAETRLKILDAHGASLDKKEHKDVDISASIETYREERDKVFQYHLEGTVQDRLLTKEISRKQKELGRLLRQEAKEAAKAERAKARVRKAKDQLKAKEARREAERQKEKTRIRKERENFWPRFCYSVRITLEAANFTPSSSRRSSIASAGDIIKAVPEKVGTDDASGAASTCDLSLSYVTSSAFWSPSYDLALSTTANTAMLCFDAQLTNMTSETWSNCKVILSTSQTTFSGLQDDIPTLVPWRVKLAGRGGGALSTDLVDSREERAEKGAWRAAQNSYQAQKPRAQLFGVGDHYVMPAANGLFGSQKGGQQLPQVPYQHQSQQQANMFANSMPPPPAPQAPGAVVGASLFGNAVASGNVGGGGLFGASSTQSKGASRFLATSESGSAPLASAFAKKSSKMRSRSRRSGSSSVDYSEEEEEEAADEGGGLDDNDGATILEPTPSLSFQESAFEETGLTATYDLPSLKTLKPSSTASKQRVARISFTNVVFSHTVIAKYKPVAYLKAKLRNTSKLTLLKGQTGLTLDGTFMGRSSLPRCSAGDTFSLSLGVDPAIKVAYPKPDVKRSTTGVFTKGDNSVYTRTVMLVNSRATAGKPVNITVLDQVPVSEDEKLRIDIAYPRGLSVGASSGVAAGVAGKETDKDWGRATATLKKGGEVAWDVQLAAGKSVKLMLQYDVMCPSGERVAQV
ncbi:hypothetical protein B0H66DRAFT_555874 [Apodospora peruviana]|uniref:Mucoidy inhibitor-like protein n=1 Tax=Apodospora peruviana TaxID=516989 RepID=A0AAE0HRZ2_9PEZI|nr:hypothetical protein B0H66DRAFT_571445 [Apodospora peruviana]KAK3317952.1 hypothetical protein B0H66DRAFT_555874 [Apodospora peruviana]